MMFSPKVLEQHIAILGKTGSGKTVTAKGIVEHLLRKKERVCIVDPVSAWWGLRSDSSGKGLGFPVVIFGGQHGDVEIGGSHGAAIAEIVAASETPTIIDLKSMSVKDRTAFFTSFAVTIMQKNQGVLHMVIDEAHLFAPKGRVNSNQAGEMLSETNNLVTGGRGIGLRFILITQRPAKLHNDCLASIETLVAMRLTLPADRDAAEAWMKECASVQQGQEVLASLPRLKTGEGWIWSPEAEILERTTFPMITTFDSSNPKNLHRTNVKLQSIDLDQIRTKLDKAATDVVNNDPVQLKRLLAKAQAELKQRSNPVENVAKAAKSDPDALKKEFDRGALSVKRMLAKEIARYQAGYEKLLSRFRKSFDAARATLNATEDELGSIDRPAIPELDAIIAEVQAGRIAEPVRQVQAPRPAAPKPRQASTVSQSNGHVSKAGRKVLTALAQFGECPDTKVGALTGYSAAAGHFGNVLSELRAPGYIEGERSAMRITEAGMEALGPFDPLPTGPELQTYWKQRLPKGAADILGALIDAYPDSLADDTLGELTGYSAKAGHFGNCLSELRTRDLISGSRSALRASEDLFA